MVPIRAIVLALTSDEDPDGGDAVFLGGQALTEPEGLRVLVTSDRFERVHYALCIASTAAALDRPVTLFVTLGAIRGIATHGPDGGPGWASLPSDSGPPGAVLDQRNRGRGVAGFEELLQACISLGVEVMVCTMGLRGLDLELTDLRADVPIQPGGLATLLTRPGELVVL